MPMKGCKHSEETKQKMSLIRKGRMPKNIKLLHSPESRKKVRETWKLTGYKPTPPHFMGEKSSNWRGGVSKDKICIRERYRKEYYLYPTKRRLNQKRRGVKKGGGDLPIKRIQQVYEDNIKYYGTLTCYLCLQPILFGQDSLEHKIPLSRAGTNEYDNLAVACGKCNSKKHDKTEEEYREVCH